MGKAIVQKHIVEIYHKDNGVPGYRRMQYYLSEKGMTLSSLTVLKYMQELGLQSIVRRKKQKYRKGKSHRVFPDLLQRAFKAATRNTIWCTDFTYLILANGKTRYNCTIIDLYDWVCYCYNKC